MKLEDLKKGNTIPGDSGAPMDKFPEWMDFEQFNRGRQFYMKHTAAIMLYLNCSVASGLSFPTLIVALVYNNKTDTPKKAFVRYYKTFLHVALWHIENVWEAPNGRAHKSVKMVRNMHKSVYNRMNSTATDSVDLDKSDTDTKRPLFVSQYDMAMVQSAFFGAVIANPEAYGIKCTKDDLTDYMFFWRCIGYLLGIQDEYNICSGTYEECMAVCKEIADDILIPALESPPKDYDRMAEVYVAGTNMPALFSLMSKDALVSFLKQGLKYPIKKLGFLDTMRLSYLKIIVFLIRWFPGFERFSNYVFLSYFHSDLYLLKL